MSATADGASPTADEAANDNEQPEAGGETAGGPGRGPGGRFTRQLAAEMGRRGGHAKAERLKQADPPASRKIDRSSKLRIDLEGLSGGARVGAIILDTYLEDEEKFRQSVRKRRDSGKDISAAEIRALELYNAEQERLGAEIPRDPAGIYALDRDQRRVLLANLQAKDARLSAEQRLKELNEFSPEAYAKIAETLPWRARRALREAIDRADVEERKRRDAYAKAGVFEHNLDYIED
jgi:hypothetical protein